MKKFIIKWLGLDIEISNLKKEIEIATHSRIRMAKDLVEKISILERVVEICEGSQNQIGKIVDINNKLKDEVDKIRSLIHVGVDVHNPRFQPSWCVVCLKGPENGQDIVNFFEIRYEDYKHLKEIFKQMGITSRDAIDMPLGHKKNFFRF